MTISFQASPGCLSIPITHNNAIRTPAPGLQERPNSKPLSNGKLVLDILFAATVKFQSSNRDGYEPASTGGHWYPVSATDVPALA
jgi:hypothetical protein